MHGSFTSRTYNFNTLLGRSSFPDYNAKHVAVPPFQRGYSWEKIHVSTFWQDFSTFLDKGTGTSTYFLGPIVILPQEERILLLDGQQRLATATMLFAVIRDFARSLGTPGDNLARDIQRDHILRSDDEEEYALTMGELDGEYFAATVQQDPPQQVSAKIRSHRLIRQARSFLDAEVRKTVEDRPASEHVRILKRLKTTLAEKMKLVTIEVSSEEEAYVIFETLNDRGLRLSVPDLLLNRLMMVASSDSKRQRVRSAWNTVVTNIGQRRVSTFLRHMWISRYGDVKSQGLFREIQQKLESDAVDAVEFASWCARESENYAAVVNFDADILGDAHKYIEVAIKNLSSDRSIPLFLSALIALNAADFEKLARRVVALLVRHAVIANLNPYDLENALYAAARTMRTDSDNKESSSICVSKARKTLEAIDPNNEQLTSGIEGLYPSKPQANYLLRELADEIQSSSKALGLKKVNIEHIYPENSDYEQWPNKDVLDNYIWHIGNLTLLEPALNRDLGRKAFSDKKKAYSKQTEVEMAKQVGAKYKSWGEDEILDRAKSLLPIIRKVWQVK